MHHIHHTEGLILGSKNYREADKYYYVFTRELGMIHASAQGVRKMSSKLRYVLQDFNYVKIDFVRGKDYWRITSASKTNKLENISERKETLEIFSNIAHLLRRLLAGEDPNQELFNDLLKGLLVLEKTKNREELLNVEAVIVLRALNSLGYIGDNEALQKLIKSPFGENLIFEVGKSRLKILSEINKALEETHL